MVKLTKIYTKTGDGGRTMLGDGALVPKTSVRVEAYGAVDEANASLGLAVGACDQESEPGRAIRFILLTIQNELFDLGADLCVPIGKDEKPGEKLRITAGQTERIEKLIDEHNAGLGELRSFVLPGGSPLATRLHMARTVVRRAERRVASLIDAEHKATSPEPLIYLNRLSDLLFVLARLANDGGKGDVLWKPGAGRD
ncbi:MAG: cob(I)yrinic acid a,c-diamide adenosyltransferase [Phycisphaeraceae bacterium]|nr:MAG: cob(I)yrinic acid a,c-diamide adenosyltransferase [Phycisphaeraceae bacterium]